MIKLVENYHIEVLLVLSLISVLLLVISLISSIQFRKLKKLYTNFMKGTTIRDVESLLHEFKETNILHQLELMKHRKELDQLLDSLNLTISKAVLHKYDAFDTMGGQLSSIILLTNSFDTGVLINVIHNREGCYLYTKNIIEGKAEVNLSKEELVALSKLNYKR
jgi:hypothetical protein